jgi:hypothetical protein
VPMFRTNIPNQPVGPFRGELVVSMRPYALASALGLRKPNSVSAAQMAQPGLAYACPTQHSRDQCSVPADRCSVRATGVLPSARAAPSFVPVAPEVSRCVSP